MQQKRLKNFGHINAEAIYHAEWRRLNKETPYLLSLLLAPDDGPKDWLTKQILPVAVSRRDAAVAASIVQWLGTNVGSGFVRQCERKIAEAQELKTEIGFKRLRRRSLDVRSQLERDKAQLTAVRARVSAAAKKTGGS